MSRLGPIVGIYVDSTLAAAYVSLCSRLSKQSYEFLLMRRESLSGGKRSRGAGRRRSERHGDAPRRAITSWCVALEGQSMSASSTLHPAPIAYSRTEASSREHGAPEPSWSMVNSSQKQASRSSRNHSSRPQSLMAQTRLGRVRGSIPRRSTACASRLRYP